MFLRFKTFVLFTLIILTALTVSLAQEGNNVTTDNKNKKQEKTNKSDKQAAAQNVTVEQVVESAIFFYGGFGGRQNLEQIRKTTIERGKTTVTEADGRKNTAIYERLVLRGENMMKERIRLDQAFPDARFSLVYNTEKVFGIFNDTVFVPRDDASRSFQNQIWHSIESLLRYKENESKIALAGREKIMGVDFYVLDLTDKAERKTRYYISVKSLRVMMLDYESEGRKYRRKFYDYNIAQGTLVPYRSVLWEGDKELEETEIGTITFGQKLEETIFQDRTN